ncbi:MAG: IS110 family transposase [Burkholderiales bacterium]|nr:IS110 family transposase [Nitrosomonas sp.]MCP5274596.1 IS110 family transposase [Burkholderiales bacterium]
MFQIHGVDNRGHVVLKKQPRRKQMLVFFDQLNPCLVGIEACGSSHYWSRELQKRGHQVRLIAPQHVKPYVKGNKNDANDAAAICEAVSRPGMNFVATKTIKQQDMQATDRIHSELVKQRTAKSNQIRGLLAEYGIVVARQIGKLRRAIPEILEDAENGLTSQLRRLLSGLQADLIQLGNRAKEIKVQIQRQGSENEAAQRLQQIPGIGPITATALICTIGNGTQFQRGRDMAASIGLVPRQHSSGGKNRLLGISKRGNAHLRTLLIHGARAVLQATKHKDDPRSRWLKTLSERRNKNIAAVALANKNARIAWALLTNKQDYQPA